MYPANFGLGPVAVLGNRRTVCAVLTLGSEHTTKESRRIWETKPDQGDKSLDWMHVYVFTGHTPEELADAGVQAGTRVCIDRSKRTLVDVGDGYLGSYFLDDRAPVTAPCCSRRGCWPSARPPTTSSCAARRRTHPEPAAYSRPSRRAVSRTRTRGRCRVSPATRHTSGPAASRAASPATPPGGPTAAGR